MQAGESLCTSAKSACKPCTNKPEGVLSNHHTRTTCSKLACCVCAGAGDVFLMEEAQLVLLATALVLTPQEERAATEKTALTALAGATAVKGRIDTSE